MMDNKTERVSILTGLQIILITSILLYFGRTLFIPLSFSLLISFILYPVCRKLESRRISRVGAIIIAISLLVILSSGLIWLLVSQVNDFSTMWPQVKSSLDDLLFQLSNLLSENFGIIKSQQDSYTDNMLSKITTWIFESAGPVIYQTGVALVMLVLITVISALILYHRKQFVSALIGLFPSTEKEKIISIIRDSVDSYYNFLKGMIIVYLIVGILNSVGLAIIGVPHPILFGFMASIMTIIPYAGILIASLLPITVAWITFHSIWYPFAVIALFAVIQYLEANIIFPMAVSNKLQINMLVTLVAIIAGGIIWGAAGMILFIPFLSILKLIADKSPGMESLSKILGNDAK